MGLVANLGQPVVAMPPRDDDSTPRRARLATPSPLPRLKSYVITIYAR